MPVIAAVLKLLFASGFCSSGFFASGKRLDVRAVSKQSAAKLMEVQATHVTPPVMAAVVMAGTQSAGHGSSGPHLGGTGPAMASADMAAAAEDAGKEAAESFMARTRPKDAVDGLFRGLKTAGAGLRGGLGMAVASPVAGARKGGLLGFAQGLGVGILGGAAVAIGGTAVGVAQVGRGVYMERFAHYAKREDLVWDQETGSWVDVDLRSEEKSLEAENSDEEEGPNESQRREVKETEYYDLLNVKPGASQSEIKKAYFKMVLVWHPDKNTGDKEATQKFQKLSEVYQVLSDPGVRKTYDLAGKDGLQKQDMKASDCARLFFSLLFGLDHVEPWIGDLHIAMQASLEKGGAPSLFGAGRVSMKKRQQRRQVRCAVHLRDKLDGLVHGGEEEGWDEQMRMEAHQLATDGGQFGAALLSTLGEMYKVRSEIYLANQLAGRLSPRKSKAFAKQSLMSMQHMASFYSNAAGSILGLVKMFGTARAVDKKRKKGEIEGKGVDEEVQAKKLEAVVDESLPTFMRTAWAYVVWDIDETVKMVARKLLQDKSVPRQIRIRRAKALKRLGRIFMEEGQKAAAAEIAASGKTKDLRQASLKVALREAFMSTMKQK